MTYFLYFYIVNNLLYFETGFWITVNILDKHGVKIILQNLLWQVKYIIIYF